MNEQQTTKAVVTVAEMARMVGLSRARFYQLMGSTFPEPNRDQATNRPYYTEEQQQVCLEVRRRNCGINGKPILFYARRGSEQSTPIKRKTNKKSKPKATAKHPAIVDAVKALGLVTVTGTQVSKAVTRLFPDGIHEVDQAEVIRSVFVHLLRQDSGDNLG